MNTSTRRLLETRILSTAELSVLIGVPMITLQKWAERGQVDFVKKGRTYLFDRRDFADRIKEYSDEDHNDEEHGFQKHGDFKKRGNAGSHA